MSRRRFEMRSIKEFKGLQLSSSTGVPLAPDASQALSNFTITKQATLRKRNGFFEGACVPALPNSTYRLLGRYMRNDGTTRFVMASATRVYEINIDTGASTELLFSAASIADIQSMVVWKPYGYYLFTWSGVAGSRVYQVSDTGTVTAGATTGATVAASQAVVWKDRLWKIQLNGTSPEDNYVRYSDVLASTFPSANFEQLSDSRDGFITAIIVYNDLLYIFKNNSIYMLSADGDISSWTLRLVHNNIGCVGAHTPHIIDGMLYFLSAEGVFRTDGTNFEDINRPIHEYSGYYGFALSRQIIQDTWAVFWDRQYIWARPGIREAFVYNVDQDGWASWNYPTLGRQIYRALPVDEAQFPYIVFGSDSATTYLKIEKKDSSGVWQDLGTVILSQWKSTDLDDGAPTEYKRNMWNAFEMVALSGGLPGTTTFTVRRDGLVSSRVASVGGVAGVANEYVRFYKGPGIGRHRLMGLEIIHEGNTGVEIVGAHIALMPQLDYVPRTVGQ